MKSFFCDLIFFLTCTLGPGVKPVNLGQCDSFADMGQSIAQWLGLEALNSGKASALR